jgi:periplasmic protein CpxP/Spy
MKLEPLGLLLCTALLSGFAITAQAMSRLAQERAEHAQTATAVDDLRPYAEISEAHAAGTKRMIPVFQVHYDTMSPEQKNAADGECRGRLQERAHHAE